MLDRKEILAEIRRLAEERGGTLGHRAFFAATGISERQVIGRHWATWNDALREAGVSTGSFGSNKTPEQSVIASMAGLIQRLGKWPTLSEMSLERVRDSTFPGEKAFRRLRTSGLLAGKVVEYCAGRPDLVAVAEIATRKQAAQSDTSTPEVRAVVHGCVYMMRAGKHYKIGRTNSPLRRHREVSVNLPMPTNLVHSIETDDPPGIEAYWHGRFGPKRVRGTEFFTLTAADVAAFKRRKYQ